MSNSSTLFRTYEYRLYPNRVQTIALDNVLEVARTLYNLALEQRIKAWRGEGRHRMKLTSQCADWRDLRNADPCFWPLPAHAGQLVLRRLDKAFTRFARADTTGKKSGFPRFKGQARWRSVSFTYNEGARIAGDRLYIQNVGRIKVKWHRPIPDEATIKQARIMRRLDRWYVQFAIAFPAPAPLTEGSGVGIDLGLSSAVALDDGTLSGPVDHYRRGQARLRRLSRAVARRTKGGGRRRKAVRNLARQHERIANRRRDHLHKISRGVVDGSRLIALEDLRLAFMAKNRRLSKTAMDTSLGMLTSMIEYKAESAGARVVKVNPAHTSQDCSGCGSRVSKSLRDRVHACSSCGLVLDRDVNAAINVLNKARMEPSGANRRALAHAVAREALARIEGVITAPGSPRMPRRTPRYPDRPC